MNTTCKIKKSGNYWVILFDCDIRKELNIPKGTIYLSCELNNVLFRSKVLSKGGNQYFIQTNKAYYFIVIKNKKTLQEIADKSQNAKMIKNANACIVICGDKAVQGIFEFLIEDCSAATQNMLLAAYGLRLGGVWCGVAVNSGWYKFMQNKLGIPDKVIPINVFSLGFPNEKSGQVNRYEGSKIHYEKW